MSEAFMGARVAYCGHEGWFIADIFRVGNVNVVRASGEGAEKKTNAVTASSIVRTEYESATHHLADFPKMGAWMLERGVFVVPHSQVRVLRAGSAEGAK